MFRFLAGLVNGIVPIAKAAISELSNDSTQPFAVGLISAMSSLGFILGWSISGFIADPLSNFDGIYTVWVVRTFTIFPYILPALANAIFVIIGVLAMLFFKEENYGRNVNKARTISMKCVEDGSDEECTTIPLSKSKCEKAFLSSTIEYIRSSTLYGLLTDRVVLLVIIIFSVFQSVVTAFEEVLTLWIKLPNELGGFGMSMNTFSMISSISAVTTFFFNIFLFQLIVKYLNGLWTYHTLTMILIPFNVCLPMLSRITDYLTAEICLTVFIVAIRVFMTAIIAGISLFINNSVTRDKLATVNGLAISVSSILRAIAPMYGGTVFAASLKNNVYPIDYNLIFIINSLLFGLCIILGCALPDRINRKKIEEESQ